MGLILGKNGSISSKEWVYDNKSAKGSYVITPLEETTILSSLGDKIEELETGYTLRDYFKMIVNYPLFICLDNYFIDSLKEYRECPVDGCITDDMSFIVLQRNICVELNKKDEQKEFEFFASVDGENTDVNSTNWAIEFNPLNKMLDTPIKIDKMTVYIDKFSNDYKLLDRKIYSGDDYITLFDFIHEIIWELSWAGTPDKRDGKMNDMKDMVKDINNGTAKTRPWPDIKTCCEETMEDLKRVLESPLPKAE